MERFSTNRAKMVQREKDSRRNTGQARKPLAYSNGCTKTTNEKRIGGIYDVIAFYCVFIDCYG